MEILSATQVVVVPRPGNAEAYVVGTFNNTGFSFANNRLDENNNAKKIIREKIEIDLFFILFSFLMDLIL